MRLIKALAAGALTTLAAASFAGPSLDFEGIGDGNRVGDFYNSVDRPLGISFSDNAMAFVATPDGGGLFTNLPSHSTAIGIFAGSPTNDTTGTLQEFEISIADGFSGLFSLFFTTRGTASGEVQFFDNQGQALLQASLALATVDQLGCADDLLCNWRLASADIGERKAYSVKITGTDGLLFIDNMALGSTDTGNNVPEPGSLALLMTGLAAAALGRRRGDKIHST